MSKPTYKDLEAALYEARNELRDAIKLAKELATKMVYRIKVTSSRVDKILSKVDEANWRDSYTRKRSQDRKSKMAALNEGVVDKVAENLDCEQADRPKVLPKTRNQVMDGDRIVRRHLETSGGQRRKEHDAFPAKLARVADLMYGEIEREDGSLPSDIIVERLAAQHVAVSIHDVEHVGKTHEWFALHDGDIAIAKCGGIYE